MWKEETEFWLLGSNLVQTCSHAGCWKRHRSLHGRYFCKCQTACTVSVCIAITSGHDKGSKILSRGVSPDFCTAVSYGVWSVHSRRTSSIDRLHVVGRSESRLLRFLWSTNPKPSYSPAQTQPASNSTALLTGEDRLEERGLSPAGFCHRRCAAPGSGRPAGRPCPAS